MTVNYVEAHQQDAAGARALLAEHGYICLRGLLKRS